eukprot:239539-Amphidinium_carterae.5
MSWNYMFLLSKRLEWMRLALNLMTPKYSVAQAASALVTVLACRLLFMRSIGRCKGQPARLPAVVWLVLLLCLACLHGPSQPPFAVLWNHLRGAPRTVANPRVRCQRHAQIGTTTRSPAAAGIAGNSSDVPLEQWRVQPDGRFRGSLADGVIIEIEAELVGPSDPGVLLGSNGVRYILGEPAGDAAKEQAAGLDLPSQAMLAVAGLAAALGLAGAVATNSANMLQPPGPVTKTNVSIVETWKTNADGKTVKVIEKKVTKERTKPGTATVVTETNTRTEKELRKR